jgi:hypothetical protein
MICNQVMMQAKPLISRRNLMIEKACDVSHAISRGHSKPFSLCAGRLRGCLAAVGQDRPRRGWGQKRAAPVSYSTTPLSLYSPLFFIFVFFHQFCFWFLEREVRLAHGWETGILAILGVFGAFRGSFWNLDMKSGNGGYE